MRLRTRLSISLFWIVALHARNASGKETFPVLAPVHERMQAFVDAHELAGAVTLVAVDGKIAHLDAAGFADRSTKRPMQTDNLFSIASMTKPVTAVAALLLVDEGKLSLDQPIARHLPQFSDGRRGTITLRQLLSHTSGLGGNQQNVGDLAETVKTMAKRPMLFDPGTKWAYSPSITVTGRLVEVVAQMPFETFLETRIFEPLGMKDTTFSPSDAQAPRVAQLHKKSVDGTDLEATGNWFLGPKEGRTPNPSGGLFSTALDLFKFWQMLLNGGEFDGKRLLKPETVKLMTTSQTKGLKAGFVPGSAWGLGVGLVEEPQGVSAALSPGSFGHGGVFGTQVWVDPSRRAIYLLLIQKVGILNSDASDYRKAFQDSAAKSLPSGAASK